MHSVAPAFVSAMDSLNGAVAQRGSLTAVVTTPATGGATGEVTWTFTVDDADLDDVGEVDPSVTSIEEIGLMMTGSN